MKDYNIKIVDNKQIANKIFMMEFEVEGEYSVKVGQFVNISLPEGKHLLRRPFCVANFDESKNTITIIYQVVGEGTEILSTLKVGTKLNALIGLGNGFDLSKYKKVMIIAGGMGVAVFPSIFNSYPNIEAYTFFGFNGKEQVIMEDYMRSNSKEMYIATADGSYGYKGFVTDVAKAEIDRIKPDVIVACGPEPMFKAVKKIFADDYDMPILISMERRMGCGIGACLVCNCKVKVNGKDEYLRACKDGPVFEAREVDLDD